jgi:hypothetical protein
MHGTRLPATRDARTFFNQAALPQRRWCRGGSGGGASERGQVEKTDMPSTCPLPPGGSQSNFQHCNVQLRVLVLFGL